MTSIQNYDYDDEYLNDEQQFMGEKMKKNDKISLQDNPRTSNSFAESTFRFLLNPFYKQKTKFDRFSTAVCWDAIDQVIVSDNDATPSTCPICFETPPMAPRVTRCGHIFCLPCILLLHSYPSIKTMPSNAPDWRLCPICGEVLSLSDLKCVRLWTVPAICINSSITTSSSLLLLQQPPPPPPINHQMMIYNIDFVALNAPSPNSLLPFCTDPNALRFCRKLLSTTQYLLNDVYFPEAEKILQLLEIQPKNKQNNNYSSKEAVSNQLLKILDTILTKCQAKCRESKKKKHTIFCFLPKNENSTIAGANWKIQKDLKNNNNNTLDISSYSTLTSQEITQAQLLLSLVHIYEAAKSVLLRRQNYYSSSSSTSFIEDHQNLKINNDKNIVKKSKIVVDYYQSNDGRPFYLHPIVFKFLENCCPDLAENIPGFTASPITIYDIVINESTKKIHEFNQYLHHLPENSNIILVDINPEIILGRTQMSILLPLLETARSSLLKRLSLLNNNNSKSLLIGIQKNEIPNVNISFSPKIEFLETEENSAFIINQIEKKKNRKKGKRK